MDVHRSGLTKRPPSEGRVPLEGEGPAKSERGEREAREGSVARLERAIRLTEERYRAVFDQAFEGIFLIAADYSIVDANESACRMLGYTHEELLVLRATEIVHPEDLAAVPIRFKTINPGGVILSERRLVRKDGSVMPGELSTKALLDGTFQVVVRDVTDRNSAQAQVLLADRMSSLEATGERRRARDQQPPGLRDARTSSFCRRGSASSRRRRTPATLEAMTAAVQHSREGTEADAPDRARAQRLRARRPRSAWAPST